MKKQKFIITAEEKGQRLDMFLSLKLDLSRAKVQQMILDGEVFVNKEKPRTAGKKVSEYSTVEVIPVEKVEKTVEVVVPEKDLYPEIKIIEETNEYLVLFKPSGLLVHPTEANETHTLADWLVKKYPALKKVGENLVRPGIVHRLDREASGLLVVAKTQKMFLHLKDQFKNRLIEKEYVVLVHGVVAADHAMIDFKIDRGTEGKMAARPRFDELSLKHVGKDQPGKDALTEFFVETRFVNYTLLKVRIYTGRTHQIRVHMFAYSHPVVGDTLYENKKLRKFNKNISRIFLHAAHLSFTDTKGKVVDCKIDLPKELKEFLEVIV